MEESQKKIGDEEVEVGKERKRKRGEKKRKNKAVEVMMRTSCQKSCLNR